jgi:hypothetical protein
MDKTQHFSITFKKHETMEQMGKIIWPMMHNRHSELRESEATEVLDENSTKLLKLAGGEGTWRRGSEEEKIGGIWAAAGCP